MVILINPPQNVYCVICKTELVADVQYYQKGIDIVSFSEIPWNVITSNRDVPQDADEVFIENLYCSECRLKYQP